MLMPSLGVIGAYGGETAEYHNAFAFYQLSESPQKILLRMWLMIEPSLVLSEFPFPTCCFADVSIISQTLLYRLLRVL